MKPKIVIRYFIPVFCFTFVDKQLYFLLIYDKREYHIDHWKLYFTLRLYAPNCPLPDKTVHISIEKFMKRNFLQFKCVLKFQNAKKNITGQGLKLALAH